MDLGLNWIDLIIIITLFVFVLEALGRSLVIETLDFLSFLLAFFLSLKFYNLPAKFFETQFDIPRSLSLVIGFMVVWFFTEITFYFIAKLVLNKIPKLKFSALNYLSIVPAFFRGLILVALFLVLLATFPIQPKVKISINDSKLGSFILKYAYQLEQPIKNIFGGVTNDSLTFLTIKPATNESVNLGFQTQEFKVSEKLEFAMIDLVNRERTSRGLKALEFDATLRPIARSHSEDMFKRGYFSHYSPEGENVADRADKAGIEYLVIGENLAYAPSLELAHKGLMNSEGHRANILSEDFGRIGIGVIDGEVYGLMFTQVFSN